MLSILVPVYNFDVRDFVTDLHEQACGAGIGFEILCIDDCSHEEMRQLNRSLGKLNHVTYQELPANVGRSKIRNILANKARHEYLLFVDCDSKTVSKSFIRNYVDHRNPSRIIYGGRCYEPSPPSDPGKFFRWYYGTQREQIPYDNRKKEMYRSFMTNNLMVPKTIYQSIKMNEEIKGYGHEDTAFGQVLRDRKIPIIHIDNPLCHIGLEDASEFLEKTDQGLKNLSFLIKKGLIDEDVRLYRFYKKVSGLGMNPVIKKAFQRQRSALVQNLLSKNPNLKQFDFYKLGQLIELMDQE